MVKIEVNVVDKNNGSCSVTINRPKHFKSSTENEKSTANAVQFKINNSIKELSKGDI